ncbi:MAG: D-Ala-D-Ala dipeptidase [Micavibrio sp.]|nr:D-Ala-D-Ala dipeptidase [Micavibrio sp.]
MTLKSIASRDLIDMHTALDGLPIRFEIAYARDDNLLFGERIYKGDAKLILHRLLSDIVIEAARNVDAAKHRLILYDGLRTSTAQARMLETRAVKDNPQWLQEPRLLSPPGKGGHPRGMAVDVSLETVDGTLVDMGTSFDYLAADPSPEKNPAHREFTGHASEIYKNRKMLDDLMMSAADNLGTPLLPLPQEWWDFRLPPEIYDQYAPLSDEDLPQDFCCCD